MPDFDLLINSLNDEAFAFCLDGLSEIINFNSLKKSDIRKIDLIEKLNDISNWTSGRNPKSGYCFDVVNSNNVTRTVYIQLEDRYEYSEHILWYLNSYLMECVKDSRAEEYKTKAYKIIQLINNKNTYENCIDFIDDLSVIFICLLRRSDTYFRNQKKYLMNEVYNIQLNTDDLKNIRRFFLAEQSFPENNSNMQRTYKLNTLFKNKRCGFKNLKHNILNFMYIYSVIFLCRNLQNMGEFSDKEEIANDSIENS